MSVQPVDRQMVKVSNLLIDLQESSAQEQFLEILARPGLRIERIVSSGHASPPGFWYDQAHEEWVVVLTGAARLRFEDEEGPRSLGPGDYLEIAAHRRHRVEWTDPAQPTIWLAVHHGSGA